MARGFTFRLETLLRVRAVRERDVRRRLATERAELALLNRADDEAQTAIRSQQNSLLGLQTGMAIQSGTIRPIELARGRAWIAHLQRDMAERALLRQQRERRILEVQNELREARQQTKMIEKLRERRWGDFAQDRRRREQRETDDVGQQLRWAPALNDESQMSAGAG